MEERNIMRDESLDVRSAVAQRQQQTQTYEHGSYVPGENGAPGGIYIDHEEEMRRQTANSHVDDIKNYLAGMDAKIEAVKQGKLDATENEAASSSNEQMIINRSNVNNPEQADIAKVSQLFAQFEPTANGLAMAGSQEAMEFKAKMDAVESGKIDLENFDPNAIQQQNDAQVERAGMVQEVNQQPVETTLTTSTPDESNVVQFNVDADKADVFLTTLSLEDREKITRSNSIVINEIKKMDIPVVTRTITSMEEFKKVLPRQSHSGVVETPNVNSGYSATLKGCGSMALATIIPDDINSNIDYAKRFQLCYDCLVDTSIGKLSFSDFCALTHINDIPNMLFNILRASDPDDNLISIECSNKNCGHYYTVPYKLSELLDVDSIPDDMSDKVNEIMTSRHMKETADAVHNQSPMVNPRYIEFDQGYQKVIVKILPPSGTRAIEVYPKLIGIYRKYSQYVAGLLPYIHQIILKITPDGQNVTDTFTVTDDEVMAEIISDLKGSCIQGIGRIMESIPEYQPPQYSFKGKFVCPKCGNVQTKVPCSVDRLIFYRVEQAIQ